MTDLVPIDPADGILLPAAVEDVRLAMTAYLEVTKAVLEPSDWQGRPDVHGSFIKKSGWQKVAKAYRLSTEIVAQTADRDDTGGLLRAGAIVRAVAPNGQYREATGYCDIGEPRFATVSGRHKLENDLRNTAATRAENRAISNLCGLGAVSAEEMADPPPIAATDLPTWARSGNVRDTADALERILAATGADPAQVHRIGNLIFERCDNTVPACVVTTLQAIVAVIPEPIPDDQLEVQP